MTGNLDLELWKLSVPFCGVDEAGRGALAGPVVAAAVVMPPGRVIAGVDDSKKLTSSRREEMYDRIVSEATGWCVAASDARTIERVNIEVASFRAMLAAIDGLPAAPGLILVDGKPIPRAPQPCRGVIRGDGRSYSIACASILAKVSRDRIIVELDGRYPGYGLARNKGYPTSQHLAALASRGPSPVHRRTYRPVRESVSR